MSMDVSAPAWAPWRRSLSLLNTVLAVTLLALPLPGLGSACTPNINIPKNSKVTQIQNQSLSLRCPVHLCSKDLPNVTWCRIEKGQQSQCENVKLGDSISSGWEEKMKMENEAVHVLRFKVAQINYTGYYQCSAAFKGMQIVGSIIEVIAPVLSPACIPNINVPKNLKVIHTNSRSLYLRCPVHLCSQNLPIVTWCRINRGTSSQCENVKSDDRISSGWEDKTEDEAVHVLRFQFVQLNDTGYYRCLAAFKGMQIIGSAIEVSVPESIDQPSLELNGDGFPECRASGRGSPANISWIPNSDYIKSTTNQNLGQTWTVISTYGNNDINVTAVICLVSHSTFTEPWIWPIALTKSSTYEKYNRSVGFFWMLAGFIIFVVSVIGMCVCTAIKIQEEDNKDCTSISRDPE